jgi:hypothetical protein
MSCLVSGVQAQEETTTPALQTIEGVDADLLDLPTLGGGGNGVVGNDLGITMGAYTLYPSIELLGGYDSNVFATSAPTTGSLFTVVRPAVELRSEWLNHSLKILASGGFGFYLSAPTQNFQNYGIVAEGKFEIREDLYISAKAGFVRNTEALGTPDTSFAQAPTVVDSFPIEVSLYQRFNRFFYQLTAAVLTLRYYDNSTILSTGLPGSSRDRTDYAERIRFGYEINDDTSLYVAPGLEQRIYQQYINQAGQQRDSNSWFFTVGATTKINKTTTLDGFIGYQSLSYVAGGPGTGATTFGLTGYWRDGYDPLTLRPSFLRSINESAQSNYQNYISTSLGVDWTYDIHGPWQALGGISINSADYTPAYGVSNVNPRTDYFFKGSIGLMYSLRPQVQIGPLYEYTSGWSTDVAAGGPSYTRNMISIRLIARR